MGKRRRAAKKVVKRARPIVAKIFKCLFCNHEKAVNCKIDRNSMTGELSCTMCDAKYQTQINSLTEPIDIFTDWLDETVETQKSEAKKINNRISSTTGNSNNNPVVDNDEYDDEDEE